MNFQEISEIFSYSIVIRAFVAGILISLCASLLGVVLVLKKYSLIGHGLADIGFASLSLAVALGISPIYVSMPIVIIASFIIMAVSQNKGINGDVAIGVVSTGALALGIIITSVTSGFNIDVYNYMFGSIWAMNDSDVYFSVVLAFIVIGLFILFYNRIFIITSDENFAKALNINVTLYQFLISLLTAITIVIGMRIMGTLLISSLIIFPAVSAKMISRSFKILTILSASISVVCFISGMLLSFLFDLPTGASIVVSNIIFMIFASILSKFKGAAA